MSDERSPNYVDQHIGARIRLRRLTTHVSQEGLADKLNITFQQIQKVRERRQSRCGKPTVGFSARAGGTRWLFLRRPRRWCCRARHVAS